MTTLFARISDNVLEPADWPVRILEVLDDGDGDGVVVSAIDLTQGVYSWDAGPAVGWTRVQLDTWAAYDPTGDHPEVYHDLAATLFPANEPGVPS